MLDNWTYHKENLENNLTLASNKLGDMFIFKINPDVDKTKTKDFKFWNYKIIEIEENGKIDKLELIELKRQNSIPTLSNELVEFLYDLIDSYLISKAISLFSILNKCEKIFQKEYLSLDKSKLIGYMGEIFAIYKMQKEGYDLSNDFHSNDLMQFDFYLKNSKKYLEVKSKIGFSSEFILKHAQILSHWEDLYLIVVNLIQDDNGINIVELLNLIKSDNESFNEHSDLIKTLADHYGKIKDDIKINLERTSMKMYRGSELKLLEITGENNQISEITYMYDFSTQNKLDLETFLNENM